jgi:hypothetical protein
MLLCMRVRRPLPQFLFCAIAVLALGCGSDSNGDAGASLDAAVALDSSGSDAAATVDTGVAVDSGEPDSGMLIDGGMNGPFGNPCIDASNCASGYCERFGMTAERLCTQPCMNDTECPTGSRGMMCNLNGFCRP